MQTIKFILSVLKHLLTLKRLMLMILLGSLSGLTMAAVFPHGTPFYASSLYGVIGLVCAKLAFWLAPLDPRRVNALREKFPTFFV